MAFDVLSGAELNWNKVNEPTSPVLLSVLRKAAWGCCWLPLFQWFCTSRGTVKHREFLPIFCWGDTALKVTGPSTMIILIFHHLCFAWLALHHTWTKWSLVPVYAVFRPEVLSLTNHLTPNESIHVLTKWLAYASKFEKYSPNTPWVLPGECMR